MTYHFYECIIRISAKTYHEFTIISENPITIINDLEEITGLAYNPRLRALFWISKKGSLSGINFFTGNLDEPLSNLDSPQLLLQDRANNRLFWIEQTNGIYKIAKYSLTNKKYNTFKVYGFRDVTGFTYDPDNVVYYLTDGEEVYARQFKTCNMQWLNCTR